MNKKNQNQKRKQYTTTKISIMLTIMLTIFTILITTINAANVTSQNEESTANLQVTIPQDYQKINSGEELLTSIKIMNLANIGRIDVILNFKITNHENQIIYTKKETVAIETQANFVRTFKIPENTKTGKYKLQTTMIFADGKESTAEINFQIINTKNNLQKLYRLITILIIITIPILIWTKTKKHIKTIKLKLKINKIIKKRIRQ